MQRSQMESVQDAIRIRAKMSNTTLRTTSARLMNGSKLWGDVDYKHVENKMSIVNIYIGPGAIVSKISEKDVRNGWSSV